MLERKDSDRTFQAGVITALAAAVIVVVASLFSAAGNIQAFV